MKTKPTFKVGDKIKFIGKLLTTFRQGEIDTITELPNDDLDNGRLFRLKNRTIHKDWLYGCVVHPSQFENLTEQKIITNWKEIL